MRQAVRRPQDSSRFCDPAQGLTTIFFGLEHLETFANAVVSLLMAEKRQRTLGNVHIKRIQTNGTGCCCYVEILIEEIGAEMFVFHVLESDSRSLSCMFIARLAIIELLHSNPATSKHGWMETAR